LSNNVKKLLSKENLKTHTKTFSMEIKDQKSKSPIPSIKSVKNIKDILLGSNNNVNRNSNQNILTNMIQNSKYTNSNVNLIQHHSNYKTTRSHNTNNINNNLVSSSNHKQGPIQGNSNDNINPVSACDYNNFNDNSYTNNNRNIKNDINLRNYILKRVNQSNVKPETSRGKGNNVLVGKQIVAPVHFRSNSNNVFG
jgi:hypothetical protein